MCMHKELGQSQPNNAKMRSLWTQGKEWCFCYYICISSPKQNAWNTVGTPCLLNA